LLRSFQNVPELLPAWEIANNDTLVEQFKLPVQWSEQDQQTLAGVEPKILNKVADGWTLGEVLGAAPELRKRLETADAVQKAVAFTIIDWARTGLTESIPAERAEQLWTLYLPTKDTMILDNKDAAERHEDFAQALKWARQPIPGTATMLVTRVKDRLRPEDYLVAHPLPARKEIPRPVWDAALEHAMAAEDPVATSGNVAYNAAQSKSLRRLPRRMEKNRGRHDA
jgi:hypothetical protein